MVAHGGTSVAGSEAASPASDAHPYPCRVGLLICRSHAPFPLRDYAPVRLSHLAVLRGAEHIMSALLTYLQAGCLMRRS